MDRPDVADDNAKHLFEYSVKQNDNIKKYFIIDKNSKDYSKISKISKNIIHFGSLKHKIYYIFSDKIISSHVNHEWLNPFYYINQKLYSGLTTTKKCFLQHGVIKDDLSDWLRKFYHNLHLFLTLSEYEKDSIINGNYNYDDEVVQLLGLPRYDKLKGNNTKKEISEKQSIECFKDPFSFVPVGQIAEIADKFTRNEITTSNEIRQASGMKPSRDPNADILRNKNLSAPSGSEPIPTVSKINNDDTRRKNQNEN